MAAFETPWIEEMSYSPAHESQDRRLNNNDPNPPTLAAFSPTSGTSAATKQRSTILVHRKSPLLVATPPAATRALAFSHPFILPLSQVVGLVTWSTGDPWESFLVLVGFWAITLYGDEAVRWAGPILLVGLIILGMYTRRYSPLSSTGWTPGQKLSTDKKRQQESNAKHQKSLDEILETMNTFTSACNIFMEPLMQLTDFLSTQRTATSATTRPALTSLFIRILFVSPIWIALTAPPFYILTTRRVVLSVGTVILSWHSRPARVSRTILWRSLLIRRTVSFVTGLSLGKPDGRKPPPLPPRQKTQQDVANSLSSSEPSGVRFTFVVFENQRRWLGIGWTTTLLAYERAAWTDEHLNASDSKDDFQLPQVEHGSAHWRWVQGSDWQVEAAGKGKASSRGGDGWIFYDNKWQDGRRGQDGWGRYTRRRKWYRDAELVERSAESEQQQQQQDDLDASVNTLKAPVSQQPLPIKPMSPPASPASTGNLDSDSNSIVSRSGSQSRKRSSWFRPSRTSTPSGGGSGDFSGSERSTLRGTEEEEAPQLPPGSHQHQARDWEIGDDVKMGLG